MSGYTLDLNDHEEHEIFSMLAAAAAEQKQASKVRDALKIQRAIEQRDIVRLSELCPTVLYDVLKYLRETYIDNQADD